MSPPSRAPRGHPRARCGRPHARRGRLRAGLLAPLPLLCAPAAAQVRFELAGSAEVVGERLVARVDLTNRGATPVFDLLVDGELAGAFARVPLPATLAPGAEARVELPFPARVPRPGLHALIVRIDFRPGEPPAPEGAPRSSQLGFLLLPLGGRPPPALALDVGPGRVAFRGESKVRLRSLDGAGHRVQLRVHTAPGLAAHPRELELDLPGGGSAEAALGLLRSGADADTRHGFLVEARVVDGPLARSAVAAGVADVLARPNRVRRMTVPLLALATAALLAALVLELRRHS